MDINIGETPAGRLKMELFSDIVPKCVGHATFIPALLTVCSGTTNRTAENFRQLCTGEYRYVRETPLGGHSFMLSTE